MQQMTLFGETPPIQVVNVASVPKLSPFRYPGGKTWLVPRIRQWLSPSIRQLCGLTPVHSTMLIEPFAGGGIVSLTAAAEKLADHVTMVEIDEEVAAVWKTILDEEDWAWLMCEITSFDLTYENVKATLAKTDLTLKEQAFRTILRNRVNRGGILARGAGLIKQGELGRGIKSRWYPETLSERIQNIVNLRDRITFIHGDGLNVLKENIESIDSVFFIDPPYTAAGKRAGSRLYTYSELNHEELFEIAHQLKGDFLMTYDDTGEIRSLARQHDFDVQIVPMKNTHHAKIYELLIGRNLDWLRFF